MLARRRRRVLRFNCGIAPHKTRAKYPNTTRFHLWRTPASRRDSAGGNLDLAVAFDGSEAARDARDNFRVPCSNP
jgi:hypothetical protein